MRRDVVTFGCRLNAYESEVIKENLAASAMDDVAVFNTCTVTKEAERQARQAIRRYRREHPETRIIVTGCAAQVHPETFEKMEEVDAVLGNEEKMTSASYQKLTFAPDTEKVHVNDIMSVTETASHLVGGFEGRARAFLQVQNGCDHRCTFCIIPYGRGNSRSVPIGEIVQQTRMLAEQGYQEMVLTGVDLTSYGNDLPGKPTLGQMMRRLLAQVPELTRLRLSSIDVAEIDEDLYRLIEEEPRLMPHFHLSLQAGDNMILKRMKRRHTREDVLEFRAFLDKVRPDAAMGADIIAGFPTETEAMFENSRKIIEEARLVHLHIFPYSEREGTPAANIPADKQVPKQERKARAKTLRDVGDVQLEAFLQGQVGSIVDVVVEDRGDEGLVGRTPHYTIVDLGNVSEKVKAGDVLALRIMRAKEGRLQGEPVQQDAA
jgi:threonylcarbamoyladenosine tRNA methylthiotransferase MtaB